MYRRRLTTKVLGGRSACTEQTLYVVLFTLALAAMTMSMMVDRLT